MSEYYREMKKIEIEKKEDLQTTRWELECPNPNPKPKTNWGVNPPDPPFRARIP